MSRLLKDLLQHRTERVAELTSLVGSRVEMDIDRVLDRSDCLILSPPGIVSANGSCHLLAAADDWVAINLARPSDMDLIPALIRAETSGDPLSELRLGVSRLGCEDLITQAGLLGLPLARVGEALLRPPDRPRFVTAGASGERRLGRDLRVVDLSSLWAGPLCGAVFAEMGATVLKVESQGRADSTRKATPAFWRRLNHRKQDVALDFSRAEELSELRREISRADILMTSARPRAFAGLGLTARQVWTDNPHLIWVAVTGHGWREPFAHRVAFGDDAAAAGGLVGRTEQGEPRFLGDALADPVTGLQAAIWCLEALQRGQSGLVDVSMADCSALVTRELGWHV